jgi:hypothetical protein|uniref:Glutamine amidotransferase domain-containing protein n=1 Tax=Candidatus Methanophagaceae archaeon ANME-1 ERB6 TaxID=2759912 RepID=A0A7G9YWA6_9EURY|nr:hypothetical protein FGFEBGFE_00011 [Methanosarcinales archaeon ANME-1 ERB6]
MKVLIVQHVECEGPGYLEDFLCEKGIDYEIARMYAGEFLPNGYERC